MFDPFLILEYSFRELALFAGIGYLISGIDEALIDAIWLLRSAWHRFRKFEPLTSGQLYRKEAPGRFAVLVPAWDESAVLGPMLDEALRAYADDQVHIFVGCYPNDPATIEVARPREGPNVSVIVLEQDGKTTKAHCLNVLFSALMKHEAAAGFRFAAIVLHDAEDVVSPYEMRVFDLFIDRFAMIQLPVVPLPDRKSRWISGHYRDEFAESHGKTQVVRQALGAALPGAGVGCMIRRDLLEVLAAGTGDRPFAEDCLTEDYELGLRLREMGFKSAFIRVHHPDRFGVVATKAYFPGNLEDALKQKTRWMVGIGLAGWDRLGWGRGWAENWMRLRDRKGVLAAVVSVAGYAAAVAGGLVMAIHYITGRAVSPFGDTINLLISVNGLMLLWRLGVRAFFTTRVYGVLESCPAVPRTIVSNIIAIMTARRAIVEYRKMRRSGRVEWSKTDHKFPEMALDE